MNRGCRLGENDGLVIRNLVQVLHFLEPDLLGVGFSVQIRTKLLVRRWHVPPHIVKPVHQDGYVKIALGFFAPSPSRIPGENSPFHQ
jgi:hypothetical protein